MNRQNRFALRGRRASALQIACVAALLGGCGGGATTASDPAAVAIVPQVAVELVPIQT